MISAQSSDRGVGRGLGEFDTRNVGREHACAEATEGLRDAATEPVGSASGGNSLAIKQMFIWVSARNPGLEAGEG